jgi:hypothetical protein
MVGTPIAAPVEKIYKVAPGVADEGIGTWFLQGDPGQANAQAFGQAPAAGTHWIKFNRDKENFQWHWVS